MKNLISNRELHQKQTICGKCGKVATFNCPTCHMPYYCGKECQEKHWEERHKKVCYSQTEEQARARESHFHEKHVQTLSKNPFLKSKK